MVSKANEIAQLMQDFFDKEREKKLYDVLSQMEGIIPDFKCSPAGMKALLDFIHVYKPVDLNFDLKTYTESNEIYIKMYNDVEYCFADIEFINKTDVVDPVGLVKQVTIVIKRHAIPIRVTGFYMKKLVAVSDVVEEHLPDFMLDAKTIWRMIYEMHNYAVTSIEFNFECIKKDNCVVFHCRSDEKFVLMLTLTVDGTFGSAEPMKGSLKDEE